ncbi:MAG: SDR family oxidoreductase [Proteobacteria bacterium]|nr:SDR family oxidoreductase [Pseudomonadota bacterium]
MEPPGRLLCIGLGYSARALCRRLTQVGFEISGTSRSSQHLAAIEASGWKAIEYAGAGPSGDLQRAIADASHVLVSAAPGGSEGDPTLPHLREALAGSERLAWIGYLSTIGVYGDRSGGWVDESTPVNPKSHRSQWRAIAERQWLDFASQSAKRVEVFRLPGIYGPGRSPFDQLLAGTARRIVKPGQVFNRIHVEDLASGLAAAMLTPARHDIYNLTDNEPAAAEEVVRYAAELIGVAAPPAVSFDAAGLSPMAASFYGESKRVSNRRMRETLGVTPAYPSYREGLEAIARELGLLKSP